MNFFGTEFFSCTNWDTKEKGLVGVSKNQVWKYNFKYHLACSKYNFVLKANGCMRPIFGHVNF